MSTLLVLAAVAGGTLATYLYDDESPPPARMRPFPAWRCRAVVGAANEQLD